MNHLEDEDDEISTDYSWRKNKESPFSIN